METGQSASSSSLSGSASRQGLFASPSGQFGGPKAGSSSTNGLAALAASANGGPATPMRATPRGKRNSLADFGTPIKVANSSPYRTPEPSSRAASLLLRSPFGTPASKTATPTTSGVAGTSGQATAAGGGASTPPKPLTGSAAVLARIQALGGGASVTRPLQGKLYLPYSSYIQLALQTNIDRLYVAAVLSVHVLLSLSLFSPLSPLASLALPLRPTLVLLSTLAFALGVLPLIVARRLSIRGGNSYLTPKPRLSSSINALGFSFPFSSPGAHYLWSLSNPSTWLAAALYALSGLALAGAHGLALMLYANNDEGRWSPYLTVPIRTSDGYRTTATRPNERLFFLMGSNLLLGACYSIYRSSSLAHPSSSLLGSPHFASQATVQSASSRISVQLRRRLPTAFVLGLVLPTALLVGYLPIRRPLFRLLLSIMGHHSPLRPIFIPSFRSSFLSIGLLVRTTALGTVSALAWETVSVLWDVFATQPFTDRGGLSAFSRAPKNCLISGIQARRDTTVEGPDRREPKEAREYYSHFAFAEQAVLAATEPDRRKAIFRDVGSSTPGAAGAAKSSWQLLAQECLAVIDEELVHIARRGQAQSTMATSSSSTGVITASASSKKPLDPSHDALQSGAHVVKPAQQTIWDKLASSSGGSQPAKPASSTTTAVSSSTPASDAGLSDLLHRIAPRPETDVSAVARQGPAVKRAPTTSTTSSSSSTGGGYAFLHQVVSSMVHTAFSLLRTAYLLLPSDLQHVLRTAPVLRSLPQVYSYLMTPATTTLIASRTMPVHAALDVWSSQILSALLAASVTEDEYGSVALSAKEGCGVEQVVSALTKLLLEIQSWQQQQQQVSQSDEEKELWKQEVEPLVSALRSGITIVLAAFEPKGHVWASETQALLSKAFSS